MVQYQPAAHRVPVRQTCTQKKHKYRYCTSVLLATLTLQNVAGQIMHIKCKIIYNKFTVSYCNVCFIKIKCIIVIYNCLFL